MIKSDKRRLLITITFSLNRRVDQMQESVFSIVDRIESVNATLQTIEKQRIAQQDGGNLMDLNVVWNPLGFRKLVLFQALISSELRNRENTRRQTLASITDKKEE